MDSLPANESRSVASIPLLSKPLASGGANPHSEIGPLSAEFSIFDSPDSVTMELLRSLRALLLMELSARLSNGVARDVERSVREPEDSALENSRDDCRRDDSQ